jgi:DNA-binding NarL/FixJ family response regulator
LQKDAKIINITIACSKIEKRKALCEALSLEKDAFVITPGADGFHALRSALLSKPDIIALDLSIPDIESINLAPIVKRYSPETKIIVLCSPLQPVFIDEALRAGISGFFLCGDNLSEDLRGIASAVKSVFFGGIYMSPEIVKGSFKNASGLIAAANFGLDIFSQTELSILNGICRGLSDKEIALDIRMSEGSVRNSICAAKKKTGLENRTRLCLLALQTGLIRAEHIPPPPPPEEKV